MGVLTNKYRFFWNLGSGWKQTYPLNERLEFRDDPVEGHVFSRKILETKLVFANHTPAGLSSKYNGFDIFSKYERSKKVFVPIPFRIEVNDKGTWKQCWTGIILPVDADLDYNKCEASVQPRVKDRYSCIFDNWDEEKNVLEETGAIEGNFVFSRYKLYTNVVWSFYVPNYETDVKAYHATRPSAQVQSWFDNNEAGEFGFFLDQIDYEQTALISTYALSDNTYWDSQGIRREAEVKPDQNPLKFKGTWIMASVYAYEVYEAPCDNGNPPDPPPGAEWIQITGSSCPDDTFYWYRKFRGARCEEPSEKHFTYRDYPNSSLTSYNLVVTADEQTQQTITKSSAHWVYRNNCGISNFVSIGEFRGRGIYRPLAIDNGMSFNEVLKTFAADCGLSVKSNFYGINPDGFSPDNQYYTKAKEQLQELALFQLSDVANPFATQNATIARATLKQILNDIKVLHNAHWDIVGDALEIEHFSHYLIRKHIDLRKSVGKHIKQIKEYSFSDLSFPKFEKWTFFIESDANQNRAFDGVPIKYSDSFIDEEDRTDNYATEIMVTNFSFFSQNEDYQRQRGLLLLESEKVTVDFFIPFSGLQEFDIYFAVSAVNFLTGLDYINASQSIPNLLETYHTIGRPQDRGLMNEKETSFESEIYMREGKEIKYPLCTMDFWEKWETMDYYRTYLGWGRSMSVKFIEPAGTIIQQIKHR